MCVKPCACCSTDAAPFLGWVSRMVLQHRGRMVAIARQEGVLAEDALDCAQEAFQTFLLVPQARALVDAPEDCARLLSTLVRNAARNRRRRHHHARPHTSDGPVLLRIQDPLLSSEALLLQSEEHLRLRGCVATLGEMQRRVVTLRMLEEHPGEDVAELLGVSRNHVAVLLLRAKERLRACMLLGQEA